MLRSISLDLLSHLPSPTWFLDPPSQSPKLNTWVPRPQLLSYLFPHSHHLPPVLISASPDHCRGSVLEAPNLNLPLNWPRFIPVDHRPGHNPA